MKTIKYYAYSPLSKKERFNNAINLIEDFLINYRSNYNFILEDHTTNNFNTLKEEVKRDKFIRISEEGNNKSIYNRSYFNTIARLWHDTIHLNNDLDFSLEDEKIVGYIQIMDINDHGDKIGSCTQTIEDAKEIIYHDIINQVKYYYKNKKFVDNQKKFVYSKFLVAGV